MLSQSIIIKAFHYLCCPNFLKSSRQCWKPDGPFPGQKSFIQLWENYDLYKTSRMFWVGRKMGKVGFFLQITLYCRTSRIKFCVLKVKLCFYQMWGKCFAELPGLPSMWNYDFGNRRDCHSCVQIFILCCFFGSTFIIHDSLSQGET